jgi:hypothetical protein
MATRDKYLALLSGKVDNTEEEDVASPEGSDPTSLKYEKLFEESTVARPYDIRTDIAFDTPTDRLPTKDPGRLTAGRAIGVAGAGFEDVARQTVVGATSMLQLASITSDMNNIVDLELNKPFQEWHHLDQIAFTDFLATKGVTRNEIGFLTEEATREYKREYIQTHSKEFQKGMQQTRDYVMDKWATDPEYLTSTGWLEDFIRMGPQIGTQILAGMLTGGAGSAAVMFAQIAGGKTEMLLKDGADFKTAATAGLWDAALQVPLEQVGLSKLTKFMKTRGSIVAKLKKAVELFGTEVLTEYSQAYPDAATEIWGKNPDASKMAMVEEFLDKITTAEFHKQG